jgi:multidrug efflux pump subunit AcrA (membrane-fusion protein)
MIRNILFLFSITVIISCKSGNNSSDIIENSGRTPVTITNVQSGPLKEIIELNAITSFLLKTPVKANMNGYLQKVFVQSGESITKGQKLFLIRSKEAENIGNTINALDSSFRFKGQVTILSPGNGYITQLNYAEGNYVQDGELLASVYSKNSLVLLLEIPYELKPYIPLNKTVEVSFADGQQFLGTLSSSLPIVDPVSQTQSYIIKVPENIQLPENLIAKVKFVKQHKAHAFFLPKDAILTNETQSEFWIMKMMDTINAIKIPIVKGLETQDKVEIISPAFDPKDKILLTGNYGLPDTAQVVIENPE